MIYEYLLVVAYAFIGIGFISEKGNVGWIKLGGLPLLVPLCINAFTEYGVVWASLMPFLYVIGSVVAFGILGAYLNRAILSYSSSYF